MDLVLYGYTISPLCLSSVPQNELMIEHINNFRRHGHNDKYGMLNIDIALLSIISYWMYVVCT